MNFTQDSIDITDSVLYSINNPEKEKAKDISLIFTGRNSLLSLDSNKKSFFITQEIHDLLSSLHSPCYVVSISGSPLSGKSSLLNLIISLLSASDNSNGPIGYINAFKVGDGKRRTTDGLEFYCMKLGDKNLLFLDMEGDNDPFRQDEGPWVFSNFMTTAMAISHIHLYNYMNYPQYNFQQHFESTTALVRQNKLHIDFEPKVYFVKRNHDSINQEDRATDYKQITDALKETLSSNNVNYSVHLFETPQRHIIGRATKESCVKNNSQICLECQSGAFLTNLKAFTKKMIERIQTMAPYENGLKLLDVIEKVITTNTKDLPFALDLGCIANVREAKLHEEKIRILSQMKETDSLLLKKELSKQVQKIIFDQTDLIDQEDANLFDDILRKVLTKLVQVDYLSEELSKFFEQSFFKGLFSVLNEQEKELILQTYVYPLKKTMKELTEALKKYRDLLEDINKKIDEMKGEIHKHLRAYLRGLFDFNSRSAVVGVNTFATSTLAYLAQNIGLQVAAIGFGVAGGVVGVVVILAFLKKKKKFIEARKNDFEKIDVSKVPGIENAEKEEDQMKVIEDYFNSVTGSIKSKLQTLDDIFKEDGENQEEEMLVKVISNALELKIKGGRKAEESQEEVKACYEKFKAKLEKLKNCV